MNQLYRRLAFTNIKNSKQFYLPYLLTAVMSVMLFYCMYAMKNHTGFAGVRGGGYIVTTLTLGTYVTGIFVVILLFYTNSFIMKRRKKELGVYNILGMEKRHIAKVMFWETLISFLIAVGGGLVFGIAFQKLLTMILYRLTGLEESIPFYVSGAGCVCTTILFGIIFATNLIYNFLQIKLANPITLLRSANAGEREPKTKILLTVEGVVCILAGYYIAITTENLLAALNLFFVAVILVIAGTYALFTAGSIAFLKLLRKNRKYYYQTRHFTTVSGMIYRMKQNAVGLANICILSTMVLVMVSTTISMYVGVEDALQSRYPADISVCIDFEGAPAQDAKERMFEDLQETLTACGRKTKEAYAGVTYSLIAAKDGAGYITVNSTEKEYNFMDCTFLQFMTREQYERETEEQLEQLAEEEVTIIASPAYAANEFSIQGIAYRVKQRPDYLVNRVDKEEYTVMTSMLKEVFLVIVEEDSDIQRIYEKVSSDYAKNTGDTAPSVSYALQFDIDGTRQEKREAAAAIREKISTWKNEGVASDMAWEVGYIESRADNYDEFMVLHGGIFFLGLFLGIMFLMITVLIIYYKQISEGYEDRERFAIMEKVGMSNKEVKAAIRSQIKTVFFLPLVTATIHLAAAFPMLKRILIMMNLSNATLFVWCMAGTVLVFGLIYLSVFLITSRSYYKIVGNQIG